MNNKVMIITTTYNSQYNIFDLIDSCARQSYKNFELIIADDGSTDFTNHVIEEYTERFEWITHLKLEHGERGIARYSAIQAALKKEFDFLFIIDSDMILQDNLLKDSIDTLQASKNTGALVIKEIPVSRHDNVMTRIKLFERKVINNAKKVDKHSIEAARFWRIDEYLKTGGINPGQISFEETQPTIRYIESGGTIKRLISSGLIHDEKKVTLRNLLAKKKYHFKMMPKTLSSEEKGFMKALTRWYLFRPVMYQPNNLWLYIKHPLMTLGMLSMYFLLTFIGVSQIVNAYLATGFRQAQSKSS